MKKSYLVFAVFAAILMFLLPSQTRASHALGADIYYSCASTTNPNQYNVIVTFYRECGGGAIAAPTSISLSYQSASCGLGPFNITLNQSAACRTPDNQPGQGTQANTGICGASLNQTSCNGGALPGAEVYTYCGTITLPGQCPDWVLSYSECCRNSQITNLANAASFDQYVYALLNNTNNVCNNAPFFTSPATRTFCSGFPVNYNHGAVDIDGDSLVFSLIQPLGAAGTPVAYSGGLNVNTPLNTASGFQFDPATGQMTFTPVGAQAAVITVLVEEYRNGVLIGSTMRDIQFKIVTTGCSPNNILPTAPINLTGGGVVTGPNGTQVIQVCPGAPLSFDLPYVDAGGSFMTVTSNVAQSIPGATTSCLTCTGTNDTAILRFTWTPTAADSGLQFFTVNYANNACPIQGGGVSTIQIFVYNEVSILTSSNTFCGVPVQLQAIGGSVFNWSPPNGLSSTNISNPIATPNTPTFYTVTSDCGVDTITINIAQPFTFDAGANDTICLNGIAQLNAVTTGPGAPFAYVWSPSGTGSGITTPNIANPPASPSVTTTYLVEATASNGCFRADSLTVTVQGVAPNITALASEDTVCPGGTVQLDLTASPTVCGPSSRPCTTTSVDYTIGTGASFNSSNSGYPAIYGHFWESGKHQILYRASELQALGLSGGTLNSIAFNIAQLNGTQAYYNFTIKVGCTSATSLSTWQSGLTTVVNPRTVNIAAAWNTYAFDNSYDWDGTSNLVVEVCFDNSTALASFSLNSQHQYTTTGYNSVIYVNQDGSSVCGSNIVGGTSADRPNTRFGICQQGLLPGTTISWTPTANMNNPNIANPLVRVFNTTNYIVNVVEGACTGSSFVTVTTDNSLRLTAGPDTSICTPAPVRLTANAIGTPGPITLSCGVNGTACGGPSTNYTLGTNAQITSNTTPYKGIDDQARLQYLFRGNEISATGVSAGIISAISWNVNNKNTTGPLQAFTIKIGCTSADSLSTAAGFQPGLTTVFGPANVTTAAGWNTHTLTSNFDWDGYSNIIVEVSFQNALGSSVGEDIVQATPTAFGSVLFQTTFFGGPSTPLTRSTARPDVRFGICPPPPGQFTYHWTPSIGLTDPITGLPTDSGQVVIANPGVTTSYVVDVTDGNCVAYDTVLVDFYSNFTANISIRNAGCFGSSDGDIIAEPVGGYAPFDFVWTDAAGTVIKTTTGQSTDTLLALPVGTYFVLLSDSNGCFRTDTAVITVPSQLTIDSITSADVTCFGLDNGEARAYVSGGSAPYLYDWSNGVTIDSLTSLAAGTYVLTVTDASGCTAVDSVTVIEPTEIFFIEDSTLISCYQGTDGSATITITGGGTAPYTYLWSGSQTTNTIQGLSAGIYNVTAFDSEGCFVNARYTITAPDSFIIDLTNVVNASCFNTSDGSATASVGGVTTGYSFVWSNGEVGSVASSLPYGNNFVTVTVDSSGCVQTKAINITYPPRFTLTTAVTAPICYGGADGEAEVTVSATGGTPPFFFQWSNGQQTAQAVNLFGGQTYYVTVTDASAAGCPEFDTITVPQPDSLTINLNSTPVSCYGETDGTIRVDVAGGTPPYSYSWSNGGQSFQQSNLPTGSYSVTITDNNGCSSAFNNINIDEPLTPITWDTTVVNVSCPGKNDGAIFVTALGGTPPYIFSLNNGNFTNADGNFLTLQEGVYELAVIDANGCQVTGEIEITAPDGFELMFDPKFDSIQLGQTYTMDPILVPSVGNYSYSWQPANSLDCDTCQNPEASPIQTTVYQLTVFDENNCPRLAQFTLFVQNQLLLYIPNAFSPNGDGLNDLFQVYAPGATGVQMKIFNRWGEKVYDYEGDFTGGWNGFYKGDLAQIDVYIYYVEVIYQDGQKIAKEGSITIVK
jgi:gliding motility-associated-like protein